MCVCWPNVDGSSQNASLFCLYRSNTAQSVRSVWRTVCSLPWPCTKNCGTSQKTPTVPRISIRNPTLDTIAWCLCRLPLLFCFWFGVRERGIRICVKSLPSLKLAHCSLSVLPPHRATQACHRLCCLPRPRKSNIKQKDNGTTTMCPICQHKHPKFLYPNG